MATRKPKKPSGDGLPPPIAPADLESPEALGVAFAREMPRFGRPGEPSFLAVPSDERFAALRRFGTLVRSALRELLGTEPVTEPRTFSSFDEMPRALLVEIAKTPHHLHLNRGDLGTLLEHAGAIGIGGEDDDRYLSRYVGLRAATVLEREVEGRPLWLWVRLVLMGKVTRERWLDAAASLDVDARLDFARRALDNAYQLMRRWPLPTITPHQERDDATQLHHELTALLENVASEDLEAALADAMRDPHPEPGSIVLFSSILASRGVEPAAELDRHLSDALDLSTHETSGRTLLERLPEARRRAVLEGIQLVAHHSKGFRHLDLLPAPERVERVLGALESFIAPVVPEVATLVTSLLAELDDRARTRLADLASKGGPNATLAAKLVT